LTPISDFRTFLNSLAVECKYLIVFEIFDFPHILWMWTTHFVGLENALSPARYGGQGYSCMWPRALPRCSSMS
jgi:hypothetical protein